MTNPSPANENDRPQQPTATGQGGENPLTSEQTHLETRGNARNETPAVQRPKGDDELPAEFSAELTAEEAAKAKAALAFLDDVRKQTRQTQQTDQKNSGQQLPASIGKYSILRSLGRGGFAEVFLAEDEELDRRVALKVPLFNSAINEAGRQRFEREAKLAASLGHPQIVPVYEYGDLGPIRYIAFAWCDGSTLDQWVKENGPVDPETAARIIERLARAVEHAHQRGIVHRDLKPGNVLVDSSKESDGKPVWERLRITDFGLARNFDKHEVTLTQDGQLVGTPAYMAPEQAGSGEEVGPAADVWALGMMLFELLNGQLPFRKPDVLATIRAICDDPVPKTSNNENAVPSALDAVTRLSLRKEPAERYQSAHALAEDLQRFTNGAPVKAKPQSTLSTVAMWARRNPTLATVGSLAFLFLTLGLAGTTWQYLRATDNLAVAEEALKEEQVARTKAQRLAGLFTKTYARSKPGMDGKNLKVVDMLEQTAEEIKEEFAEDLETKWELLFQLAMTYDGLGVYEPAVVLFQQIYDEQIQSDDAESEMTLRTVIALQRSLHSMASYEQSSQKATEAFDLATKLGVQGKLLAKTFEAQGFVLAHENKPDQAIEYFDQAIMAYETDPNCNLADTLTARTSLASCQRTLGQFEELAAWLEEVVPQVIEQYGDKQPEIIALIQEYGSVLVKLKRYEQAIEVLQQQLAICEEVMGPEHGRTLQVKGNLASTLTFVGRREEAINVHREVITASEKTHGASSPHTAVSRYLIGKQLIKVGQFEEAELNLSKAFEDLSTGVGMENPWTERSHQALVSLWYRTNVWDRTYEHFIERAKSYDKLVAENATNERAITNAATSRIEAGQAKIRTGNLSVGLELIDENLQVLQEAERSALAIHYRSPVLAALIDRSEFSEAIPYAEDFLAGTPPDYEHGFDVLTSRVQAAAIALSTETSFSADILSEVQLATASELNTEQWFLLSTSLEILENGLQDGEPVCVAHRELITLLLETYEKSTALPGK